MIGVDTNVLVRYFVKDEVAQALAARAFFSGKAESEELVRVNLVVLTELAWVLRTRYGVNRDELMRVLDELLNDPIVDLQDRAAVAVAAHDLASSPAEFADLLLTAVNELHGCATTMTFDRKAARLPGMRLLA